MAKQEFPLKETSPNICSRRKVTAGPTTSFDLVEDMNFLYVKILKARNLAPPASIPCVELIIGNFKGTTQPQSNHNGSNPVSNPEWNQVFAFNKDIIQDRSLKVLVKDMVRPGDDSILGRLAFEIAEIPRRVPPDSSLAPVWYLLEDSKGTKIGGELMVSLWMGTQADEAYSIAWHSDAAMVNGQGVFNTSSKVYISPKLWYVRINVIEARDLIVSEDKNRKPNVFVKAMLGNLVLASKASEAKSANNPTWNEDLMFVAAEPFDEPLLLSVEDRVVGENRKEECLGRCLVPLKGVTKRDSAAPAPNVWYNLERPQVAVDQSDGQKVKFASKLHMRISLDGAYHVLDEPTYYTSDVKPSLNKLCKPSIGVLELGILRASELLPMKPQEKRTDAYCVAKYGLKWVRTRTIANSFAPKWNEQYTWPVTDPCTVITIGIFDDSFIRGPQGAVMDSRIGKVRIRLSTLECDRTYTLSFPLVSLHPSGVKKMGEIELAVRFSCTDYFNMLLTYTQPLLPKMHYIQPLSVFQLDNLRRQASVITSSRLSRAEPPLRKEVVDYMLDTDAHIWSTRRGKANFQRVSKLFEGLVRLVKWFEQIKKWTSPVTTLLTYLAYVILVLFPGLILPTILLHFASLGIYRFRKRPRNPPHMDTQLSHAYAVSPDELDEEFDPFPSRKSGEVLRIRYDRLRIFAGRIQTVLGDIANQGERVQSLLSWRDPRATSLFVGFCVVTTIVTCMIPFRYIAIAGGFYVIRPPSWRNKMPSIVHNFIRRMPAKADSML